MVATGATVAVALEPFVVWPLSVTVVAFDAAQESATAAPAAVDGFGVAVNEVIFTAGLTFTIAWAVTLPAALVAVRM